MMGTRQKLNGLEQDVIYARHIVIIRQEDKAFVKRRTSRRRRHQAKLELRHE